MSAMAAGARPARRQAEQPARWAALRLVDRLPRRRHRLRLSLVSAVLVVGSLLMVVVGHSLLAAGQVHLASVESALSAEQVTHRREVLAVGALETPSRIVTDARGSLHMVSTGQEQQLPYVPLDKPLPAPAVAP